MNEQIIWDFFYDKIKNPYGVAGLMGNLYVESKLNPQNLQSSYKRKFGMTDEEYTKAVDNGSYPSFVRDGAGYGLVQWTFWSRKEGLLNYAKEHNTSIGDLNMQLEYIWKEIQLYKGVVEILKNSASVREASDIVCTKYERPSDQSEKAKQNRADYGSKFLSIIGENDSNSASGQVVVLTDKVNIRAGNGKSYPIVYRTNKNASFEWVATAENNWYAIKLPERVGWISGEFAEHIK